MHPKPALYLFIAMVLFVAVRIVLLFEATSPFTEATNLDEAEYLQIAMNWMEKDTYGSQYQAWRPFGYPLFIVIMQTLAGKSVYSVILGQLLMGLLSLLLLFYFLKHLFNVQVACWASLGFAVYPYHIMWSGMVMSEVVVFCLFTGFLAVWVKDRPISYFKTILVGGLLLGILLFFRPQYGTIGLLFLGYLFFYRYTKHPVQTLDRLFLLGILVLGINVPWLIHTQETLGKPTLGNTTYGYIIHYGNHPERLGIPYFKDFLFPYENPSAKRQIELRVLPESERDAIMIQEALGFIWKELTHQPHVFLGRILYKFFGMYSLEIPHYMANVARNRFQWDGYWYWFGLFALVWSSYAVLSLFFIYFFLDPNRSRRFWIFAIVSAFTLVILTIFGTARFHVPLLGIMLGTAAYSYQVLRYTKIPNATWMYSVLIGIAFGMIAFHIHEWNWYTFVLMHESQG